MDVALLVNLLAPCLPGLMSMGKKMGEASATAIAKKVGEQSVQQTTKIWQRLWPSVSAKEAAKEAAKDVAENPNDEDSLAALRRQLKKILENDKQLASEIAMLLKEAEVDCSTPGVEVLGDRNQVIGSMSGNAKAIGSVTGNVTM